MLEARLNLFADYHQIMVMDDGPMIAIEIVTQEDVDRRLGLAPGGAIIHTARNMTVPVIVRILASEPPAPSSACDHVSECSVDVASGRLVVMGLMDDPGKAARFEMEPRPYRLRACHRGLATLSVDGLEGDDAYELTLWPAPMAPPRLLRRFEN